VRERANNNVFLLSSTTRARLDTLSSPAPPATRFADMRSVSDFITTVRGGLGIEGPALFGRAFSIHSHVGYDFYARNAKRRDTDLDLAVSQAFPYHGRLRVRGRLTPSYFYRNFLADAIDLDGDGTISSGERIYAAGVYRDGRVLVAYRQRLVRSRQSHPFGAAVELEVGRFARTYDPPFRVRSYRGPVVGAALAVDLSRSLGLDVAYRRAALASTPDTAVLLLNEPDFNRDFNGNGTTTDLRVRSVQRVDFSRREQDLDVRLHTAVAPHVTARAHYQHRWRTFSSSQPFDVLNNTRRDRRDFVGLALSFGVGPHGQGSLGGDFETQKTTRSLTPSVTGEVIDYARRRVYAGWEYHF
jgi:hypothetical protein